MADEPQGTQVQEPPKETPAQNPPQPAPQGDETARKIKELEDKLNESNRVNSDLKTTISTIQSRYDQIDKAVKGGEGNRWNESKQEILSKAKQIMANAAYDPDRAAEELTGLISEMQTSTSQEAVRQAQAVISGQTFMEKLRTKLQKDNPDFDDDTVDFIIDRANQLAGTGKYKDADSAVKDATTFVRSKFDNYAQKKNVTPPPIPAGAQGETGANKPPEPAPAKEEPKTPLQELEDRKAGLQKKVL